MDGFNYLKLNELVRKHQFTNKLVTIDDIAKEIGMPKSTFDNVRKGVVEPRANTLYKIAVFFKVTVNDFFDGLPAYEVHEEGAIVVSEGLHPYGCKEDPWKIAYQQQKEITELKLELERALNENALVKSANVG